MSNLGKGYHGKEWAALSYAERRRRVDEVKPLVAGRSSWHELSMRVKIPVESLRRVYDKKWHENRLRTHRQYRQTNYSGKPHVMTASRVDERDVAARLAEIPEDTRDLTAFLMGDPLPGRRAIDRINEARS